ncbi:hypothetical protein GGI12_005942, partial [Dipsacomyces acuminosporus]
VDAIKDKLAAKVRRSKYFSVQFDGWKDRQGNYVLGVVIVVNLEPYLLGWETDYGADATAYARTVGKCIDDFYVRVNDGNAGLHPKLCSIVTGGASVMNLARSKLEERYGC